MDKKDTDLKKYNYANLSNLYGPPLYVSIDKEYLDDYSASHIEAPESKNRNSSKNILKNIEEKFFGKTSNLTQVDEQLQSKPENTTCHVCGSACKPNDFFCSQCGSKLRVGHYDDKHT